MSVFCYNRQQINKLIYYSYKYLEKILYNCKNPYLIEPIYFYNGLNHNETCLYTNKNIRKDLLNYLDNRFKLNTQYLIWKNLYEDVYINEYTGIIKFLNLNNKSSMEILINMLKDKKKYLSQQNLIINELQKEYNQLK